MNHGEGKDEARGMYVENQMTFDEIAERLGRSDKTIRVWADEGGWREARKNFLMTQTSTHEKLHTLVQKLTDRMISDCDNKEELSPQSIAQINKLAKTIKDLYQYEVKVRQVADDTKPKDRHGLSEETLCNLEEQMGML